MRKNTISKGEWTEISEINITPMADLSITLLIILMIISPMVMQSMIKVHASAAAIEAKKDKKPEKPLFIEVTRKGFFLNTKKMKTEEDLYLRLRGELSRKTQKTVMVTAGKGVTHGRVVHVLDLAKQAGAESLSLIKKANRP